MCDIKQGINIILSKKYRLTSDSRQYILHETISDKTENLYYHSSISGIVKSLIKKNINNKNIKTLKELHDSIEEYGKQCEQIFKNIKDI